MAPSGGLPIALARAATLWATTGLANSLAAQAPSADGGLELAGGPARSFDSDEGFRYGAIVELYHSGGTSQYHPYLFTL